MVRTPDGGARTSPVTVREDRSFQPRVGSAGSVAALFGHREPDEPVVAPARSRQRPLLRGTAARLLARPWHPRHQWGGGVAVRKIQGAPDRPLRAPRSPLSPNDRPESSRADREG